jgi:hypothetical protein
MKNNNLDIIKDFESIHDKAKELIAREYNKRTGKLSLDDLSDEHMRCLIKELQLLLDHRKEDE